MAATATGFSLDDLGQVQSIRAENADHGREISPQAGRALELLGHAIEYLTDEYIHEAKKIAAEDPQVKAIQLLMRLNREIYFECPAMPSVGERIRRFVRRYR